MRRHDRECSDPDFFAHVLQTAEEVCVAFATEGAPYVLPLNFVYHNNCLLIHCATEGRKLACLEAHPEVGFTAYCDVEILREKSTTRYSSVCGIGRARLVTDAAEKQEALHLLAQRYAALCHIPTPPALLARTGVICIEITQLTGKCRRAPA